MQCTKIRPFRHPLLKLQAALEAAFFCPREMGMILPSPSGEGSGVGRHYRAHRLLTGPTPTPPRKGRGYTPPLPRQQLLAPPLH